VAGFFANHETARKHVRFGLVALFASFVFAGGDAQANGGAKYDFRLFPSVGTPTTTFRVSFAAPFRADGEDTSYELEAVGPRGCPSIYEYTRGRVGRGDRVVMKLTPLDDLYLNTRRTWCRGSYVGYVYYFGKTENRRIGYFRFGVGRTPVSLEG